MLGAVSLPLAATAQANAFGYTMTSAPYDYVAPPGTAMGLGLSDDGQTTVALPWAFEYFGVSYSQAEIQANGGLNFVPGSFLGTFSIHVSGAIELHSLDTDFGDPLDDNGADAVIGIHDDSGSTLDPLEWSCNSTSALGPTAISFTTCVDPDGDGYDDVACGGDDCDDAVIGVNPGATEVCDNAVDDDCSKMTSATSKAAPARILSGTRPQPQGCSSSPS